MTKYLLEREYTWEWWWIEYFTDRYHRKMAATHVDNSQLHMQEIRQLREALQDGD